MGLIIASNSCEYCLSQGSYLKNGILNKILLRIFWFSIWPVLVFNMAHQESPIRVNIFQATERKDWKCWGGRSTEEGKKNCFLFCRLFLGCQFPHRAADVTWEWKLSDSVTQLLRFTATENIIRDLVIQLEVRKPELIANLFILLKG